MNVTLLLTLKSPLCDIRYTAVIEGKTKLAQLPATQFQNGYSHCVNKIHKACSAKLLERRILPLFLSMLGLCSHYWARSHTPLLSHIALHPHRSTV